MSETTSSHLTITDVATYPLPGMAIPAAFQFSPDDTLLTYLYSEEGSLTRQLFAYDIDSETKSPRIQTVSGNSDETVSLEEALRRERQRQREFGITQYAWSGNGRILTPIRGGLYIQNSKDEPLQALVPPSNRPILDPRFSPNGQWIAFVQDAELYIVSAAGGTSKQLTSGARGTGKTNGLAEYIAQEEMGRRHGYWWATDSQSIAFAEVDETHIPIYRITHQGKDGVGTGAQEDHRYPFAGAANATIRLGVVSIDGGDPIWMDLGKEQDIYLARVNWASKNRLLVQRLNRAQTRLDLILLNPKTGQSQLLLTEETDVWINLHALFRPVAKIEGDEDGGFVWGSERTGFQHLYLYNWDGDVIRPLTQGNWMVTSIAAIDTKNQQLYFTATKDGVTETHLYCVSLHGDGLTQLTPEPGTHTVAINHANTHFIDTYHAVDAPPTITYRELVNGRILKTIFAQSDPRLSDQTLPSPTLSTFTSRDGEKLHCAIYHPPAQFGDGPFATVVSVYGGPHAQRVTNSWGLTVDMRAQYLSQQGFIVIKVDNRGSARRGLAFEGALKHDMGNIEVQDQVDGVRWLVEKGMTDPDNVGIYGWSYGGYVAAMALARAADTFKVAVAGAPVTHWDGYDTCYTERYMGTPLTNPQGYKESAVMTHADKIKGELLLVHGLIDENVHFRHTARLINALIHARKKYDLLLFPNERHMPRGLADRIYMEERILDTFKKAFGTS
ncbi:MAG: S9 family peptidase [Chloroflexi bacterium]|nr:S9 family peptidase [Chloroflexota bacterium]